MDERTSQDEALRLELLERIERRYPTVRQAVEMGPLRMDFVRVADPDRVLDEVAEEADRREKETGQRDASGDTLHLPYWAELWDSSYVIGAELAGRKLDGVEVLDLGCGQGLTAAASAFAGARVLAADLEEPALRFTELNTWPWRDRVSTRLTDWQKDDLGRRFPLIVGADILYERKQWEYLSRFFRVHLDAKGGEVLLGEPGRQTGELFVPWAKEQGWSVEVEERPCATRPVPVRVIRLREGRK